jgi:hypothetical protein
MFKSVVAAAVGVTLLLSSATAHAAVLFESGPGTYNSTAHRVSSVVTTADQFTLSIAASVTGFTFASWVPTGQTLISIDWAIYSGNPFAGGSLLLQANDAVAESSTQVGPASSVGGNGAYAVSIQNFAIPALELSSGTYWLSLSGGTASGGTLVYWDQAGNNAAGPAQVGQLGSGFGAIGHQSRTFQILGAAVPEPTTWALMIGGFGLAGAALRRRRAVVA